jgi:hypothetical protein
LPVEGLCCILVAVGAVWLLLFLYDSNKKKQASAEEATVVATHSTAPPALPNWPVRAALREVEDRLGKVGESALAAYRVNAPVPVDLVRTYLDQGWDITDTITHKVLALQTSHGPEQRRLPRQARRYLQRDQQNLDRLGHRLTELRNDLTTLIAAGGFDEPGKIRELDHNIRALRRALQQFDD